MKLDAEEQLEILMRGTKFADMADWDDEKADERGTLKSQMTSELREKLKLDRPLRVYLGVDPTSSNLHVGHFVPLQKLRKFQKLGHNVIFLIGDYTAMIGDPSDRMEGRDKLTHDKVMQLSQTYTDQAFKILDKEKTEIRYNSEWLAKLTFEDIIELASIFPLKQIISRRDFQKRLAAGESLRFHEALYSLMQGYDAYALECDVQVGAYDQHFNMLAGRAIQLHFGQKPHVMVTNPLLVGTDGRKMSKSFVNTINVEDNPFDMYGKTMRIADEYIINYLELGSSLSSKEIDMWKAKLNAGENPMNIKKVLAMNIVTQYHGKKEAQKAAQKFQTVVQNKEIPDDIKTLIVPTHLLNSNWVDVLSGLGLTASKGEARRLIQQGGFYVDQNKKTDFSEVADISQDGNIIRLGKRRFCKLLRPASD